MSSPDEPVHNPAFEDELERHELRPPEDGRWGWSLGRVAAGAAMIGMLAFWIWGLSPLAPRGHPDELDDDAFPVFAEARCAEALVAIDQVPSALEAQTPLDRAGQLTATNGVLFTMVEDLRANVPAAERDNELISRWLDDWDTYLDDREVYRTRLTEGIDTAFEVTARDSQQITELLDLFADVNGMASCMSPGDV